jgi:predicted RNA-binding Zn-ribbon protein involved in translation (DUF1610 family)
MTASPYETGEWLETGSRTSCPECGSPRIRVRQVLEARPLGTFSLSGTQMKFPAAMAWVYGCPACGATGPAAPRGRAFP